MDMAWMSGFLENAKVSLVAANLKTAKRVLPAINTYPRRVPS